ncbi:MAG: threonine synthase [Thermoanaerobaculales bacterium]|nr:threonine synthase [Thermoanaerobaculales bacterium]
MARFRLRCSECAGVFSEDPQLLVCPKCSGHQEQGRSIRGVLEVEILDPPTRWPDDALGSSDFLQRVLPLGDSKFLAPLPVGNTPLLEVSRLRRELGMPRLWLKDDSRNPSGSTKDRASLLVTAKAAEYGFSTIATASTGNAATALAAVCAASGQRAVVLVPAGAPPTKLTQMLAYGAEVAPIEGSYDDAFELCMEACAEFGWYNRNTALNPFTLEGKKTLALEIAHQLSAETPDAVIVPSGDGVILGGVAKGFADLMTWGLIDRMPRLIAVQPEGASNLVSALADGLDDVIPMSGAASVADSLVVEAPRNARLALARIRKSGGGGITVSDDEIIGAIARLARLTGVFAEPAAAASLAGLDAALAAGLIDRDERVVLLVTGTGLKDREAAARSVTMPEAIRPELGHLAERFNMNFRR